ncbi:protein HEAT INTOLERANT 4-like [Miscanthus floridulus]|uniref:protein HEAT INTOLERANT 4-like n=1 Tax=Miscanthus floridulus TaxID=154761 RepID=UPI00345A825F
MQDLADKIVIAEGLPEDEREKIEKFLKEKVKQGKIKLKQAEEARKKALEDMDPKQREAFENIKFYKFYPVKTPDTPDVNVKSRYINKYYLKAHYLM